MYKLNRNYSTIYFIIYFSIYTQITKTRNVRTKTRNINLNIIWNYQQYIFPIFHVIFHIIYYFVILTFLTFEQNCKYQYLQSICCIPTKLFRNEKWKQPPLTIIYVMYKLNRNYPTIYFSIYPQQYFLYYK